MEWGFLLIPVASAGLGYALRSALSPAVGRVCVSLGVGAIGLGVLVLGLAVMGGWPFGALTGGLVAALLLGASAISLPFGIALTLHR